METYTQPTAAPTAKVTAVGIAGIITTLVPLIVFVLSTFHITGIDTDTLSASLVSIVSAVVTIYQAITALVHFLAGYFKKSKTAELK